MANTFKRYTSNSVGTALATVYTVPSSPSTTSVIIGGVVSNVTTGTVNVTVTATTSSTVINLVGEDTPIPAGTALSFIDGKVVLEPGDIIKVKSSAASSLDIHLSAMEIT
jgi:hypothetical protein